MLSQSKTNSFREALAKAETTLSRLQSGTGGDEARRLRNTHNQEKVVRAYRRLVNLNEKQNAEVIELNGNF